MRRTWIVVILGSVLWTAAGRSAFAGDWPQWRGPHRDGHADPADVPRSWPAELESAWQVPVGEGHASPVVSGGRVFAFSRTDGREVVRCVELNSGRGVWSSHYEAPYEVHNAARNHGAGPKSTPVIADRRLFTFGISGILSCFDARDGAVIWRKEFSEAFEKTSPLYGSAASPIIVDGKLIVHVGGHDSGALKAFDVADGRERWSWNAGGPGYASPIVLGADDTRQLVTQSQTAVIGIDPDTGRLLWQIPFKTPYDQNTITPLVAGDLLISGGFQRPTTAVRPNLREGAWQIEEIWKNNAIPVYMSTPVVSCGLLFGFTHRNSGQLFCADAATGEVSWTGEGRAGDNAALLAAGGFLLAQFTTGELHVMRASRDAQDIVARYRISHDATWAQPALADGRLLTKDADTLTCWRLR